MTRARTPLSDIVAIAQTQGHLTYDQVNAFLPDESTDSVHVDRLLDVLDGLQVKLVEDPSVARARRKPGPRRTPARPCCRKTCRS